MIHLISPEDGAVFSVLTDTQKEFIKRADAGTFTRFGNYEDDNGDDASAPAVCVFRWISDDPEYPTYLEISSSPDFSRGTCLDISEAMQSAADRELFSVARNFLTGTTYFWRVRQNGEYSRIRSFKTLPDRIRPVYVEHVPNFRDVGGGRNAEGRRVKQGLIYRGKFLEWEDDEWLGLTENGKKTFAEKLGIRTEIDLREEMEGKMTESPAGGNVRYVCVPHDSSWGGTLNDRGMGQLHRIFDVLFDPASYPVFFHCYAGADRTGFIGAVIGGILGKSDEDIKLDYNFTALYDHRNWDNNDGVRAYFDFLWEKYGVHSFAETIWIHLTNYGIDEKKLTELREFLLE